MKRLVQKFISTLSQNSRLQPVEMLQRHAGEGLRFPAGAPLQAFHPETDIIDDAGAHMALIVEVSAHEMRQVDDDLLQDGEVGDHRVESGVAHGGSSSRLYAEYRRFCTETGRRPFALACGPP